MGTFLLYGINLAVNLRLNMGTVLLYGTNLAVDLRLNMGTFLLYGTNLAVNLRLNIPWVPEVIIIIFFLRAKRASNAAKPRQRGAKRRPSRLPSEPAKRLIISPTIPQRASGTRVAKYGFHPFIWHKLSR